MKSALLILALFTTLSANAQLPGDGKDIAYDVCANIPYSGERTECLKVVTNAKFFSPGAVGLCALSRMIYDIVPCFKKIQDTYFQEELTDACKKFPSVYDREECLNIIPNKVANKRGIEICWTGVNQYSQILDCMKTIVSDYVKPAPQLPPISVCDKGAVLTELDTAINLIKNYKVMDAFEKLLGLKSYLNACMH